MDLGDIQTDTVNTSENSINQLASLLNGSSYLTCAELVVETESGTLEVSADGGELRIERTDDGDTGGCERIEEPDEGFGTGYEADGGADDE